MFPNTYFVLFWNRNHCSARRRSAVDAAIHAEAPIKGFLVCLSTEVCLSVSISSRARARTRHNTEHSAPSTPSRQPSQNQGAGKLCVCVAEVVKIASTDGHTSSCIIRGAYRCVVSSASVFADTSDMSPRKIFIFTIWEDLFCIKLSKKNIYIILKVEALVLRNVSSPFSGIL